MVRGLAILALGALGGCSPLMRAQVKMVDDLRIRDAVAAYETARSGAAVDRCVKAKLVAIACEDAKDVGNAQAWRAREQTDCQAAIADLGVQLPPQPAARPGT